MAVRLKCDSDRQEQGFGFEHRPFWEFASLVIKSLIMFMKVVCGVSFIALVVIAMQPPVRWASFMQFAQWALLAGIYAYMLGELEGLFSRVLQSPRNLFSSESIRSIRVISFLFFFLFVKGSLTESVSNPQRLRYGFTILFNHRVPPSFGDNGIQVDMEITASTFRLNPNIVMTNRILKGETL